MKELKNYSILDIEVIDDDRFKKEKAPGKWVPESRVYLKEEVDAAIAELKAALKESEEARYEAGADAADYYQETRRLKRALYKACANWARSERYTEATWHGDEHREELWAKIEVKCRVKAEENK